MLSLLPILTLTPTPLTILTILTMRILLMMMSIVNFQQERDAIDRIVKSGQQEDQHGVGGR